MREFFYFFSGIAFGTGYWILGFVFIAIAETME
jgi:hypothetical protein